jgi:hypothetical protein
MRLLAESNPSSLLIVESGFQITGLATSPSMIARITNGFGDMRTADLGRTFEGIIAGTVSST